MMITQRIKAIAFDFGGTLDSPFMHWMKLYLQLYTDELHLPLTAENFRDSYVHAEREMERLQLVNPEHSLLDTQLFKTHLQFDSLIERGILADTSANREQLPVEAARLVTDFSIRYVKLAQPVLAALSQRYPLLLVSNYYGNIAKIAADLDIASYFVSITDSTVEGIRKPDPALWKLAIDRAGYHCEEVLVVGDSMKNDILPALSLGCQAVQGCPVVSGGSAVISSEIPAGVACITSLEQLLAIIV